jgi:L-alanine-DL-glutamate epimerase-like enolase superfamily enzyme
MNRSYFYPAGRERTHSIGALDLALWDLKGKVLNMPVHQILGGLTRNYCECYSGGGNLPGITETSSTRDRAHACMEAGFRAFRTGPGSIPGNGTFNSAQQVRALRDIGAQAREGVGKDGEWAIDFHQRFELTEAVRGCNLLEEFAPFFIEDPVRADAFLQDLPLLRTKVATPIAAGEEWGNKWDFNTLVEHHDVDYIRATLPNVGGITEMMKIAAICDTHFVGIIPHFTGPIATAALVNCLGTFSGPVLFEYAFDGRTPAHLPASFDFKNGKLYPNDRPGLGVELDMTKLKLIAEITEPITARAQTYFRPDGSITNW